MLVDGGDKCRDGCSGGFYVYVEAQRNSSRARNWTDYRDGGLGEELERIPDVQHLKQVSRSRAAR